MANKMIPIENRSYGVEDQTASAVQPSILAPAGNRSSFLAALAAGADAVYCGLKSMSARMEAKNFSLEELSQLVRLAHAQNVKVYITVNALLKPDELETAGRQIDCLERYVHPDALIVQDLGVIALARQVGFSGEIHLSTLANVTFPKALGVVSRKLAVQRVVVPRELSIDEMKTMARSCPKRLSLEAFVHGALCYAVSGRCYWSSYMGGKSGLRGRCVQPCRRYYRQGETVGKAFSCQDFSIDVLAKLLAQVKKVVAWNIEGRKKGPHYVFYTVSAYRQLRDEGNGGKAKRNAQDLLAQSLGRETTHYRFLPQRIQQPLQIGKQTASGLYVGKVQGPRKNPWVVVRQPLFTGDILRIGCEDEPGHTVCRVNRSVPHKGRFPLKLGTKKTPRAGAPVFLTDRREKALESILSEMEKSAPPLTPVPQSTFSVALPQPKRLSGCILDMRVRRVPSRRSSRETTGMWLSENAVANIGKHAGSLWVWLPPVIWPEDERHVTTLLGQCLKSGVRRFVLNAPWQQGLFNRPDGLHLWAGPFCNATNALCLQMFEEMGMNGAFISSELGETDVTTLASQSPLPLGIVISGHWPLCISRILSDTIQLRVPFSSPRGEQAWVDQHGPDYWVYPNWQLDLLEKRAILEHSGIRVFAHLIEPVPAGVVMKKRQGLWNWKIGLK